MAFASLKNGTHIDRQLFIIGVIPHHRQQPEGVWITNDVSSIATIAILLNFLPELAPAAWRLNQRP